MPPIRKYPRSAGGAAAPSQPGSQAVLIGEHALASTTSDALQETQLDIPASGYVQIILEYAFAAGRNSNAYFIEAALLRGLGVLTADNDEGVAFEGLEGAGNTVAELSLYIGRTAANKISFRIDGQLEGSDAAASGKLKALHFAPAAIGSAPAVQTFQPSAQVNVVSAVLGGWTNESTLMETDAVARVRKVIAVATVSCDESTNTFGGGSRLYAQIHFAAVSAAGVERALSEQMDTYVRNVDMFAGEWVWQRTWMTDILAGEKLRIKVRTRQQAQSGGGPSSALTATFDIANNYLQIREIP